MRFEIFHFCFRSNKIFQFSFSLTIVFVLNLSLTTDGHRYTAGEYNAIKGSSMSADSCRLLRAASMLGQHSFVMNSNYFFDDSKFRCNIVFEIDGSFSIEEDESSSDEDFNTIENEDHRIFNQMMRDSTTRATNSCKWRNVFELAFGHIKSRHRKTVKKYYLDCKKILFRI